MPSVIFIDGVETPAERATVSVNDRGFLYGDSVFETLRAHRGVPHLLADHLARLRASAEAVGIAPRAAVDLETQVHAALAAAREDDAVVRITLTRGAGPLGLDVRRVTGPRCVLHVEPLAARLTGTQNGLHMRLVRSRRGVDLAPAAKVGAYVDGILALRGAQAAGADDALLVDPAGLVTEAPAANVFVVTRAGTLVTPPAGAVFPGLTRREVLRIATECGVVHDERPLPAAELGEVVEAFLTSSVRELMPIRRIDDGPELAAPGPITQRLLAAYRGSVRGGL